MSSKVVTTSKVNDWQVDSYKKLLDSSSFGGARQSNFSSGRNFIKKCIALAEIRNYFLSNSRSLVFLRRKLSAVPRFQRKDEENCTKEKKSE